MKRTTLLGLALGMAACGSSGKAGTGASGSGGGTTGGCATARCGGLCCAAGDACIGNTCCPAALSCSGTCCAAGDSCIGNACCSASQSCGSTCCPGPDTDGGGAECVNNACCPVARACLDVCCDEGSECITDQQGNPSCLVLCEKSADCNSSTPCCELVETGQETFSGHGVCTATPAPPNAYACLCAATSECGIFGTGNDECAPAVNGGGNIAGPYVCTLNDAASSHGCQMGEGTKVCSASDQDCADDPAGNFFCSAPCTDDALCGNPGVACCNTTCLNTEPPPNNNKCCGLCAGAN